MTIIELVSVLTSSGVCAGGFGILKWGLSVERRLLVLEVREGVKA